MSPDNSPYTTKRGHDVRVLPPKYASTKSQPIHSLNKEIAISKRKATLYAGKLAVDAPVYLGENNAYFDREYLYDEPEPEYNYNVQRFAFLCKAALETCKAIDFQPDVIHCKDWHTD